MLHLQAVIASMMALKRTCPSCRRKQVVKPSEKTKTVKCKFCGADIPPKKPR